LFCGKLDDQKTAIVGTMALPASGMLSGAHGERIA
jgi:hypothetical protein